MERGIKRTSLTIGLLTFVVFGIFLVFSVGNISAYSSCQPVVTLISQDPYPVTPGDYVKIVFQVSGLGDLSCSYLSFQLVPKYPISFDPGTDSTVVLRGGTYSGADYGTYIMVPYTVRVDPDAVQGSNQIEVQYSTTPSPGTAVSKDFNLTVNNTIADFNVFVQNFNFATNQITLEILNIGSNDVQSLTVELPPQKDFTVKGPNTYIIGSLSSNDYTTATFEVSPNAGNLNITLSYNDITGVRRTVEKSVYFDPSAFQNRKTASQGSYTGYIILILIIGAIVGYILYRRHKKKKKRRLLERGK